MIYSPAHAIADVVVAGLLEQQVGIEAISDELRKAILKLGEPQSATLTIDTVFTAASIPGAVADGLRRMRKHPGLKVEAIISELRRAESYFIKAHDSYLAGYTDRGYMEMRWAAYRLEVVRAFYSGLVQALPAKVAATVRSVPKDKGSIKSMRFADFTGEEQAALKGFVHDEARAIQQLEMIITSGRASGKQTSLLIAYLSDLSKRTEVNNWIKAQLRVSFDAAEAGASRGTAADQESHPALVTHPEVRPEQDLPPASSEPPRVSVWPVREGRSFREPRAAAQLKEWLSIRGSAIRDLLLDEGNGRISLKEPPRAKPVRDMFEAAIDDLAVQNELRRLVPARA